MDCTNAVRKYVVIEGFLLFRKSFSLNILSVKKALFCIKTFHCQCRHQTWFHVQITFSTLHVICQFFMFSTIFQWTCLQFILWIHVGNWQLRHLLHYPLCRTTKFTINERYAGHKLIQITIICSIYAMHLTRCE